MRKETRTKKIESQYVVYVADDGKEFLHEDECARHEGMPFIKGKNLYEIIKDCIYLFNEEDITLLKQNLIPIGIKFILKKPLPAPVFYSTLDLVKKAYRNKENDIPCVCSLPNGFNEQCAKFLEYPFFYEAKGYDSWDVLSEEEVVRCANINSYFKKYHKNDK